MNTAWQWVRRYWWGLYFIMLACLAIMRHHWLFAAVLVVCAVVLQDWPARREPTPDPPLGAP